MADVYLTFFQQTKGWVLIEVPELNIYSQSKGRSLRRAVKVARDAITLKSVCLEEQGDYPPTPRTQIKKIECEMISLNEKFVCIPISIDMNKYRRKYRNK